VATALAPSAVSVLDHDLPHVRRDCSNSPVHGRLYGSTSRRPGRDRPNLAARIPRRSTGSGHRSRREAARRAPAAPRRRSRKRPGRSGDPGRVLSTGIGDGASRSGRAHRPAVIPCWSEQRTADGTNGAR
jgi:hypothetical protein